jgi:hemoglobin/transferrin/lactoferrin receptor protein
MASPRLFAATLAVATSLQAGQSPAQTAEVPLVNLPPVSVTATRGARPADQVPATVTVIDQRALERQSAVRPADVVRYEPGVSVGNQPGRAGQTNYVIRGIGGNRVLVLQDGLRMQDFPGSNLGAGTYTRDYVDLDTVRRVEIVRGPASALYGSDALGGVVNYILKDPADYLDETGRDTYASAKVGYSGADRSVYATATGAVRTGRGDLLLQYTRRDGHALDTNGRIGPNPQVVQGNALLARGVVRLTDADTLRVTAEYAGRTTSTEIRTEQVNTRPSGFIPGNNVLSSRGRDSTQRGGVSLQWTHDAPVLFVDSITARLAFSRLERREQTDLWRAAYGGVVVPTAPNRRRLSDFHFNQNLYIADVQAHSTAGWFGAQHRFTYGGSVEVTETTRPRDRVELNLATGTGSSTIGGETFPNKNFPDTVGVQAGIYVQDEITIGRLEITPAVRLNYYSLTPHADADSNRASGGLVVRPTSDFAVTPKLGVMYRVDGVYSVFAQYARGFRAPPYDSTNFGFTNPQSGYQILPNANLRSETSDGFELGLRGRYATASWQVSAFYNQYDNFIDTRVVGNAGGLTQFQYRNVPSVRIWGAEARGDWRFTPGWRLRGALAWARGEDTQTGQPVDSIDPVKLTTGLSYQHSSGFGADAIVVAAMRQERVSSASYFRAPAYATLDLLVHYEVNPGLTLNAGLFNVTNTKYFNTPDVVGLSRTSAMRDLYAQPGRYFAFNATMRW